MSFGEQEIDAVERAVQFFLFFTNVLFGKVLSLSSMASKKTRNFWLNEFSLFTSLLIWKREQVISNVPITNPRCEMISQAPVPEVTRISMTCSSIIQ